jgi:thiamine biosynthesis lipoprotein
LEGEIWTTRLFGKPIVQVVDQLKAQTGIEGIFVTRENRVCHTSGIKENYFGKEE